MVWNMARLMTWVALTLVMVACVGSQDRANGLQAGGGTNAFFALKDGSCLEGTYGTPTGPRFIDYRWPAPPGSASYPWFVIDGYHGVGTYLVAWPTETGRNSRIELQDRRGWWWQADEGTITVTADDGRRLKGSLATRGMKAVAPRGQSPPTSGIPVDLAGSWKCARVHAAAA